MARNVTATALRTAVKAKIKHDTENGLMVITIPYGHGTFAPASWKDKKTGQIKTGTKEVLCQVGSRFGGVSVGDGYNLQVYLTRGDAPSTNGGFDLDD